MAIEIAQVQSKRDKHQFIEFPYAFYRNDPNWIPPLRIAQKELFDFEKHPFYKHGKAWLFLALRDGEPIGRIAAILDPNYNRFQNEEAGFFGFFECVNDQEAASGLLNAARLWLKEQGAAVIRGPMNPSTNYECGLLVDGFDSPPQIMMTYNPPYYAELMAGAGWRKAKDLLAFHVTVSPSGGEKLDRVAGRVLESSQMKIRPIRLDAFQQDVERVWEVYNGAWSKNWGFVPMTREEFLFSARDMKSILVPELVLLGEIDGRTVGFALALPDINQALKHAAGRLFPLGLLKILYHKRSVRSVRVIALGVLREYQTAGVAAGFYAELFRQTSRLGYQGAELSWVLEDNTLMTRSIEAVGGKRYKTYRIYEWNHS